MDEALAPKVARLAITEQDSLRTWSRDRWTCRYCGELSAERTWRRAIESLRALSLAEPSPQR